MTRVVIQDGFYVRVEGDIVDRLPPLKVAPLMGHYYNGGPSCDPYWEITFEKEEDRAAFIKSLEDYK